MTTLSAREILLGNPPSASYQPDREQLAEKLEGMEAAIAASEVGISVASYTPAADGLALDDTPFSQLEGNVGTKKFRSDLAGKTYLVSAIPTGLQYVNGGFKLADVLGNNADVDCVYPAKEAFDFEIRQVSPGTANYESWPQGKRHIVNISGNVVHYCGFNADHEHNGGKVAELYSSNDDGATWRWDCTIDSGNSYSASCWALGEHAGQQFAIVRRRDPETDAHDESVLLARRLYEIRRGEVINVTTTDTSATFRVNVDDLVDWGVRIGDEVQLNSFGTVNGLDLQDRTIFTVSDNGNDWIEFEHPTDVATATGTSDTPSDGVIEFNPRNKGFVEVMFPGDITLGEALLAYAGTPFSSLPTLFHDCEVWEGTGGGALKTCAAGGGSGGPHVVELDAILRDSIHIERVDYTGDATNGGGGTIVRSSTGAFYGGIRGDSTLDNGSDPALWYAPTNDISAATVTAFPTGFGDDSIVDIALDETNGYVYVVATDTRYRDETPGPVPMMVGWATLAAFQADPAGSITWWHLLDLHYTHSNNNEANNGVGIQSIACDPGNALYISFSNEQGVRYFDDDGAPRTYDLALAIGANGPIGAKLKPRNILRPPASVMSHYVTPQEMSLVSQGRATFKDDAIAWQRASEVAAQFGKTMFVPPQTYRFLTPPTLADGANILGGGVDNPNANQFGPGPTVIMDSSMTGAPAIRSLGNLRMQGISFRGTNKTAGVGMYLERDTADGSEYEDLDSKIRNCYFYLFDQGIASKGRGIEVVDCVFAGCNWAFNPAPWVAADWVDNPSQEYDGEGVGEREYVFEGNRVHQCNIAVSANEADTENMRGLIIRHNRLDLGGVLFNGKFYSADISHNLVDMADTKTGIVDVRAAFRRLSALGNHFQGAPISAGGGDLTEDMARYGYRFRGPAANFVIGAGSVYRTMAKDSALGTSPEDNESACIVFEDTATRGRIVDMDFRNFGLYDDVGNSPAVAGTDDEAAIIFKAAVDRMKIDADFERNADSNALNIDFRGQSVTRTTIAESCTTPDGEELVATANGGYVDGGGNVFHMPRKANPELTIDLDGEITAIEHWNFVDTRNNDAADNCDNIANNWPQGTVGSFLAENAARVVTFRHNTGGGNIRTISGADWTFGTDGNVFRVMKLGSNLYQI